MKKCQKKCRTDHVTPIILVQPNNNNFDQKNTFLRYVKYKTWSLPFDTWLVCVLCLHIGRAVVYVRKTQTWHVSKGTDHVLSTYNTLQEMG